MADLFTVSLKGDQQFIAKIVALPPKLRASLTKKLTELALLLQRKLQLDFLSGPTGAHTLSVKSGDLRRSVTHDVKDTGSSVVATVGYGADVPYAAAHEFGVTINLPDIYPDKAKALHFMMNGSEVFAKMVKAHSVVIPERAPLRTAFKEMQPQIKEGMGEAIKDAQ